MTIDAGKLHRGSLPLVSHQYSAAASASIASGVMIALDPNGMAVMTRDMELIREILLTVESRKDAIPTPLGAIEGYDEPIVVRHVQMLVEAGFLKGQERPSGLTHTPRILITDLSWQGHEFLAAVRNKTVWNQIKQKFGAGLADLPLAVVRDVGMALIKHWAMSKIGLASGSFDE